ncbi:hypothetical protein BJ322DRAFT_1043896 [Thelephora terrestris]|uniref:Fumarylacetoacetase-like C-terminal domain-containing protein n=1 Tax=Thelephora terrestris TaxID=56493 RepID=A0A9P6HLM0_9AGAM|nr:hypothetical protein BJ322DRAFT_1043896 [Thelephora terrestris]
MSAAQFLRHGKKIVAIGRNYLDHVKELNNAIPKEPFFFLKPTSSYLPSQAPGAKLQIPRGVLAHHEVELGLVIGAPGADISQEDALNHVAGYTLAVDMTARNVQDVAKSKSLPWTAAKGMDTFTPIGEFIPKDAVVDYDNLQLSLKINGEVKQNGSTSDMMFKIPALIEHVSSIMTLETGDVILTGTPSGVGQVKPGDKVECKLEDNSTGTELAKIEFEAVEREGKYQFKP